MDLMRWFVGISMALSWVLAFLAGNGVETYRTRRIRRKIARERREIEEGQRELEQGWDELEARWHELVARKGGSRRRQRNVLGRR